MKFKIDTREMPDGLSLRIEDVLCFDTWKELTDFVESLELLYSQTQVGKK